jgi:hypothetical protein
MFKVRDLAVAVTVAPVPLDCTGYTIRGTQIECGAVSWAMDQHQLVADPLLALQDQLKDALQG